MPSREDLLAEIAATRKRLDELEAAYRDAEQGETTNPTPQPANEENREERGSSAFVSESQPQLTKEQVERYSRQIMVEGIGASGMAKMASKTVLVVGCGGLGSTVALYLAGAGVGKLILVDFDDVELSNLHRQIIHTTERVGRIKKVFSARKSCLALNPTACIECVCDRFDLHNAEKLARRCDVVVDASDNVAARYLVNDAAVLAGKPLVSGSAMRWEGQLSVFHFNASQGGETSDSASSDIGPCYRCLFPVPPPAVAVGSCNDTGVVGPVPGAIGCLQALEAIKVMCGCKATEVLAGKMLLMDGLRGSYRVVKLRPRQPTCTACGGSTASKGTTTTFSSSSASSAEEEESTLVKLAAQRPEYIVAPCPSGMAMSSTLLDSSARISAKVFHEILTSHTLPTPDAFAALDDFLNYASVSLLVLDVRVADQFAMAHIPQSVSLPLPVLKKWTRSNLNAFIQDHSKSCVSLETRGAARVNEKRGRLDGTLLVLATVCRRGIASTQATQHIEKLLSEREGEPQTNLERYSSVSVVNVDGGLNAYHVHGDSNFPYY